MERTPRLRATYKIIGHCLIWYILVAAVFTLGETAMVRSRVNQGIAAQINSLERRIEPALEKAVWDLDDQFIELILNGMVNDSAIRLVILEDDADRVSYSASKEGDDNSSFDEASQPLIFPLVHQSPGKVARTTSTLIIYPNLRLRHDRMWETIDAGVGRTALLTLILTLILGLVLRRSLDMPLRELTRQISAVDPTGLGQKSISLSLRAGYELSLVTSAFNAMVDKVGVTVSALEESKARLWSAFEDSPISMWEMDLSGVKHKLDEVAAAGCADWVSYFADDDVVKQCIGLCSVVNVNEATLTLLGYESKERLLGAMSTTVSSEELSAYRSQFITLVSGMLFWEGEAVHRSVGRSPLTVHIRLRIMPGYRISWERVLVSMLDISTQKQTELFLTKSLAEKELLLREVHHRVKNNLQIICSLIGIENAEVEGNTAGSEALSSIESRVWSMALVHEQLYESDDFGAVDFPDYVRKLCARESYSLLGQGRNISIEVQIQDSVSLTIDRAIPCGLLINELLMNSIQHGFPDGRDGTISVTLGVKGNMINLMVQDDGVGVADLASMRPPRSIGFTLVENLAAQLGGSVSFTRAPGFRVEVCIPQAVRI